MMRTLIKALMTFFLLTSQAVWAETNLQVSHALPSQFDYEVVNHGFELVLTDLNTQKHKKLKFRHAISDTQKLYMTSVNPELKGQTAEMLLVVTSVGNTNQNVQVFASPSSTLNRRSRIRPLCTLHNEGDFSWSDIRPEELLQKTRVRETSNKIIFEILIGRMPNGNPNKIYYNWIECFSVNKK